MCSGSRVYAEIIKALEVTTSLKRNNWFKKKYWLKEGMTLHPKIKRIRAARHTRVCTLCWLLLIFLFKILRALARPVVMLPGDLLIICCRIEDFFGNRERIPYEQNLIWKVGKYVIVKKKNSRLTLSWWRFLSYRDWFLYDRDLRHERVKYLNVKISHDWRINEKLRQNLL